MSLCPGEKGSKQEIRNSQDFNSNCSAVTYIYFYLATSSLTLHYSFVFNVDCLRVSQLVWKSMYYARTLTGHAGFITLILQ